eukprot:CAMPEP_0185835792 /NCGR_PEP_ID=MMETSP1353-20130828/8469_1 /TAXON_ID=1077150 /ORGANISM="Erythrolobus australicus, Strain CCMP3124" /LENGTH=467 /DNA_ID=CAMNT_0028534481 /DNA_START=1 /DNA_END=1405 /DNA_ORIENTATION=+
MTDEADTLAPIRFLHGEAVEHNGWLMKKSRGILPLKKRRYFILSGCELVCKVAPNDSESRWALNTLGADVLVESDKLKLTLRTSEKKVVLFTSSVDELNAWAKALAASSNQNIEQYYEFGKTLGEGGFATVKLGIDKETMTKYAIKVVTKQMDDEHNMEFLHRELNIMKAVNSNYVIRTFDIFDSPRKLFFVLEYMEGGTLHEIYQKLKPFNEQQVRSVLYDVISGVAYLHSKQIVHRDLKLKNVLAKQDKMPYGLKLADFGLSNFVGQRTMSRVVLKSQVGSPHYVAPEVLREELYGPAVDLWSIGVMMHIMLSGKYPFAGKTIKETLELVADADFKIRDEWFPDSLSGQARKLLQDLLREDPKKRPTAAQALQSDFMTMDKLPEHRIKPLISQRNLRFQAKTDWHEASRPHAAASFRAKKHKQPGRERLEQCIVLTTPAAATQFRLSQLIGAHSSRRMCHPHFAQ